MARVHGLGEGPRPRSLWITESVRLCAAAMPCNAILTQLPYQKPTGVIPRPRHLIFLPCCVPFGICHEWILQLVQHLSITCFAYCLLPMDGFVNAGTFSDGYLKRFFFYYCLFLSRLLSRQIRNAERLSSTATNQTWESHKQQE